MKVSCLPSSFSLLVKPSGAACNLACDYCFYLDKKQLYPESSFRMSDEVLKAYIKQLLASQPTAEVSIAWQGGEPTLMGLDFFKRSVALAKRYRQPGQNITYSLQTNGILLDDAWCHFFKDNNFLVGLSMDGPAGMHNAYRVHKSGQGSFDQVRRAWDLLQRRQVDTNILCALHNANISNPLEVYRFFRDELQAEFIQFIPIVERLTPAVERSLESITGESQAPAIPELAQVSPRSLKPEEFGRFLSEVFDEWVKRDVGRVFIQSFDAALAGWCRLPASVCIFQATCGSSLVLEHNGDLYACDHFVDPDHKLGNILEHPLSELAGSALQRQFGFEKRDRLPEFCRQCDVRFACHGECPRNRFVRSPGGEEGLNYLCAGYKLFFHHIEPAMCKMADLLRQGRAPAEVMQI